MTCWRKYDRRKSCVWRWLSLKSATPNEPAPVLMTSLRSSMRLRWEHAQTFATISTQRRVARGIFDHHKLTAEELAKRAEDAVTRGQLKCDYCYRTGHTQASCRKKSADSGGKPPGSQAQPQQNKVNHIQGAKYYDEELAIHSCQMQIKKGRSRCKQTPPLRKAAGRQRILIDSGANMIAFRTTAKSRAASLKPYFAGVSTASGSSDTKMGVSKKGTVGIIFQTGLSIEPDVVFIDDLKHNVAGSTVLDTQYGVTSVFHNGMVHLVDSSSINGWPQN